MADATRINEFQFPYDTPVFPLTAQQTIAQAFQSQSYVSLNDGTIGCAWTEIGRDGSGDRTGGVYWGTCPDVETLFGANSGVTFQKQLVEQVGAATPRHSGFQVNVQRGSDGNLYMSIFYLRTHDDALGAGTRVTSGLDGFPDVPNKGTHFFKSTDDGDTWALVGNVQIYDGGIGSSLGGFGNLGDFFDLGGGVWVLPYPQMTGSTAGRSAIARSTDYGATWSHVHTGGIASSSTRLICYNPADGYLYWGDQRGNNNPNVVWYHDSGTGGASWTEFFDADITPDTSLLVRTIWQGVSVTNGMRWVSQNGIELEIWLADNLTQPWDDTDLLLENTITWDNERSGNGMQPLDGGWWVNMDNEQILGIYSLNQHIPMRQRQRGDEFWGAPRAAGAAGNLPKLARGSARVLNHNAIDGSA